MPETIDEMELLQGLLGNDGFYMGMKEPIIRGSVTLSQNYRTYEVEFRGGFKRIFTFQGKKLK
jgi:hypothetical protein